MQYFTIEQIGPKRSRTPHGFLLCQDVPIARTGMQLYGPGETPIDPGAADVVRIERDPEEVFHPLTIASLFTAPLVNEHPMDAEGERADVTIENCRDLMIGYPLNPHRGEGVEDDVLLADLLFTDLDAITLIDAGKKELSVGYEADYEELGPGWGRQLNIRANHIALVERGRCGPRCAIGDHELVGIECCPDTTKPAPDPDPGTTDGADHPRKESRDMPKGKTSWTERIRAAFKARDEAALNTALDEEPDETASGVHVHLHQGGEANGEAKEGDQGGGVALDPAQLETAVATIHALEEQMIAQGAEMDEVWDAIGRGADSVADAFPQRDARRSRDRKGRDQKADKDDTGDAGNRDDFPGAPGSGGNRSILGPLELEAPPGTQTADLRRARDSALFEDSFAETVAQAEIIIPGVRLPTFDRAAAPRKTVYAICALRTRVLDQAFAQPETRELIEQITGGRFASAKTMACDAARMLFRAVADNKARANKALMTNNVDLVFGGGYQANSELRGPADLQTVLDKHYAAQRPPQR